MSIFIPAKHQLRAKWFSTSLPYTTWETNIREARRIVNLEHNHLSLLSFYEYNICKHHHVFQCHLFSHIALQNKKQIKDKCLQTNNSTSFKLMFYEFAWFSTRFCCTAWQNEPAYFPYKRFEEFWRVWNKALVLSPPKQLTWIVTDAGAQTNSFLEAFCRTRQHSFSPTPKIAQNNCIAYLFNESKIKMQAIWQMLSVQAQKISP